ncbi:MAG: ChbG/HpnK family deacetylase [Nanoarchaeota archaeon]|nr:ChbG/HpnK family deacetylase [Nanoarchaeota archaeon]
MKQLIVNADDFRLSEFTNKGIVDCFEYGIVNSTTIMPNGNSFDDAVKLAKKFKLKVGIHINLTQGRPLTQAKTLTENNDLTTKNIINAMLHKINLKEVEKEAEEQIRKVLNAGIKPTHLDSHKHIHVFPGIIDVFIKLAKRYNINKIRLPLNKVVNYKLLFSIQGLKHFIVRFYSRKAKRNFKKANIKTTEQFYGVLETGKLSIASLKKILKNVKGTAELMCHPGYFDPNVTDGLRNTREKELRAVTNQEIRDFVKKQDIKMISFGEL